MINRFMNRKHFVFPSSYDAYKGLARPKKKKSKNLPSSGQYRSTQRERSTVWTEPKRHIHDTGWSDRNQNAAHVIGVTTIAQGNDLNERFRQVIFVRGVKVHLVVRNTLFNSTGRLRYMLLQPKSNRETSVANVKLELFRGNNATRGVNFDSVSLGSHKTMYEINPDLYHVYLDKTVTLTTQPSTTIEGGNTSSQTDIMKFIPVNRKVTFEGPLDTDSNTGLIFVYWFMADNTNTTVESSGLKSKCSVITFYKDMF